MFELREIAPFRWQAMEITSGTGRNEKDALRSLAQKLEEAARKARAMSDDAPDVYRRTRPKD